MVTTLDTNFIFVTYLSEEAEVMDVCKISIKANSILFYSFNFKQVYKAY